MESIHEQLQAIETRLRDKRSELARARDIREQTKASYAENESESSLRSAEAAVQAVRTVEQEIEAVSEEQIKLLGRLGDAERGLAGWSSAGNGWHEVARKIDLPAGVNTADVAAASLLRAQVPGTSVSLRQPQAPGSATPASPVQGPYYAYQAFSRQDTGGAAAVTDFTVSFLEPTVTGLERAPAAVSDKPVLPATYGLATPDVRQHAIVAEDIPERLLEAASFGQFLDTEMRRQTDLSVDRHVAAQITAASPPSGSSGADLIHKIRNAVASSRSYGAWPSVLLLSPTDSAGLDTTQVGSDQFYLFLTRDTGTASPVWSLQVIETAAVTNPTLLDPGRLGVFYLGSGSVVIDNLSGLKTNVARIRAELEALLHVRCPQAAFVIA